MPTSSSVAFLLHALPTSFHRIRYYGFLANGSRSDNIALCRRSMTVSVGQCRTGNRSRQRRSSDQHLRLHHLSRMRRHHAAHRRRAALLQPSAVPLRHVMTSIAPPAITRIALNIAAQADAMRTAMPINFLNLNSRSCQRRTSKLGYAPMPLRPSRLHLKTLSTPTKQSTVTQGLPARRRHYPHSDKTSAASFNPASMRSRSPPTLMASPCHATS